MENQNSTTININLRWSEIAQLEVMAKARGITKEKLAISYLIEDIKRDRQRAGLKK